MLRQLYWFTSIVEKNAFEFNGPRRAYENADTTCCNPSFDESGQLTNLAA